MDGMAESLAHSGKHRIGLSEISETPTDESGGLLHSNLSHDTQKSGNEITHHIAWLEITSGSGSSLKTLLYVPVTAG